MGIHRHSTVTILLAALILVAPTLLMLDASPTEVAASIRSGAERANQPQLLASSITVDSSAVSLPTGLESAITSAIIARPASTLSGDSFRLIAARVEHDWALVSLDVVDVQPNTENVNLDERGSVILAHQDAPSIWVATLRDTASFEALLQKTPEWFIAPTDRAAFLQGTPSVTLAQAIEYRFPWTAGTTGWLTNSPYRNPMWHSENSSSAAIDMFFQGDWRLLAPTDGVVTNMCVGTISVDLWIRDDSGYTTGYVHLDKTGFDTTLFGKRVVRGKVLGKLKPGTWSDMPCGATDQTATSAHLHWVIPRNRALVIDGWTITYPNNYLGRNGVLKGPGSTFASTNLPVTSNQKAAPNDTCFTWVNDTRLDCFVRGTDDRMYQRFWNGAAWSEIDLGGGLRSAPTCFTWVNDTRLDCFVRGTDDRMHQRFWNGAAWSDWIDLGGILRSAPTCFTWLNDTRLDCFVRGIDDRMYQRFWNGAAWSDWIDLGGGLRSAPTCFTWLNNTRLDCFVRGIDDRMYQRFWNGAAWSDWIDLGGGLRSAPACFTWVNDTRLDCFVQGTDDRMYQRFWNGAAWSDWIDLGDGLRATPACFTWVNDTRLDCFGQGTDNGLHQRYWNGTGWSSWINLGGSINLMIEKDTVALPNQPPNRPILLDPQNASKTSIVTPTLTWSDGGDPDNGPQVARTFRVRLQGTDGTIVTESSWLSGTSWTTPILSDGSYSWQVQSFDGATESDWTGAWNLTIATLSLPPIPYIQSDYTTGGPGSIFTLTVGNVPPGANATIAVREPGMTDFRTVSQQLISADTTLVFCMYIPTSAAPGIYTLRVTVAAVSTATQSATAAALVLELPLTIVTNTTPITDPPQSGTPVITLLNRVYLPLIQR